ncbi:MAG: hypothetical protein Q9176_007105 [Flavoplaca citrina]
MFVGRTRYASYPARRIQVDAPPISSSSQTTRKKILRYPRLRSRYFSLLRTCRQVSEEARTILYGRNTFVFEKECSPTTNDHRAPRQTGDEHVSAIEPSRGMDLRSLKQVKLELSASVKAFEMSQYFERPEEIWEDS